MYAPKIGKTLDLFRPKARWSNIQRAEQRMERLGFQPSPGHLYLLIYFLGEGRDVDAQILLWREGGGGWGGSGPFTLSSACINNGCGLWANVMVGEVEITLRWHQGGRKASPVLDGTCTPYRRKSKYSQSLHATGPGILTGYNRTSLRENTIPGHGQDVEQI